MSKIEDKAVDIMDKAMVGAEKLSEKLAELAQQYGPDVIDAGLMIARLTAAQKLAYGFLGAAIAIASVPLAKYIWRKRAEYIEAKKASGERYYIDATGHEVGTGVCLGAGLMALILSGLSLTNIWNWVGVFEPKLWIAHRILEKAL